MSGRVYQGDNEDLRAEGKIAGRSERAGAADLDQIVRKANELMDRFQEEVTDAKPFDLPGFNRHMDAVANQIEHCGKMINRLSFPTAGEAPGGSTPSLYALPEGAKELQDLIEHRNMNFAVGNIFKACFRLGQKDGVGTAYDLRKILFFAARELRRVEAMNGSTKS